MEKSNSTKLVTLARVALSIGAALSTAALASANTATVCVDGVCRTVETGPLVRDFAQDVNADPPKSVFRQRLFDKKLVGLLAADIGVSIASTRSLVRCRADHGIGPCNDGGYGEFKARETLRQAQTATLDLCAIFLKRAEDKQDGRKFWWLFPTFNTAWNASNIARNAFHTYPPKPAE